MDAVNAFQNLVGGTIMIKKKLQTNVLLVENHALLRLALKITVVNTGCRVIGEAKDGEEAIFYALQMVPDLVLMDIYMPRLNGFNTARMLKEVMPKVKIILMMDETLDREVIMALSAGANGVYLKMSNEKTLSDAIDSVMRGETWIDPALKYDLLPQEPEVQQPCVSLEDTIFRTIQRIYQATDIPA